MAAKKKLGEVAVMGADEESHEPSSNDVQILETMIKRLTEADKLSRLEHTMVEAERAY